MSRPWYASRPPAWCRTRPAHLASLLLSAMVAIWMLLGPDAIASMQTGPRYLMLLVALWGLGAGFTHGVGLVPRHATRAWLLGAPETVVGSLGPKSITTPIAVEVVKSTGGYVSLAAGAVAITGIVGALVGGL
ncbi:cyd operon YbgE family protein, partial [uncultured Cobetia sp.]|uniref:cyd operon YbgE family protein n=1 Tax=uncultured Cobetia sp. TaxID=410706 RepID=UPI00259325A0